MCIIAIDKKNKSIDKNTFETMYENNPDGFGGMYAANNKIISYKCFNVESAYNWYCKHKKKYPESVFILHFRISTGGSGIGNTHPFKVNNDCFFVHNGHFSGFGDKIKNQSDTNEIRNLLKLLPANFLDIGICKKLIRNLCGVSNKLVFLNSNGYITIFNDDLFTKDKNGFLFSNNSYISYYNDFDDPDPDDDFFEKYCDKCSTIDCMNCLHYQNHIFEH